MTFKTIICRKIINCGKLPLEQALDPAVWALWLMLWCWSPSCRGQSSDGCYHVSLSGCFHLWCRKQASETQCFNVNNFDKWKSLLPTLQLFGRVEGIQEREFRSGSSAISSTLSSTKTIGCALVAFFIRSLQWRYFEKKVKASQSLHLQKYHSWGKIWGNRVSADIEWCILRLRHWLMVTWYWGYSRLADRETGSDSAQSWTFGWSRRGGEPPVAWLLNKLFEERLSCNEVALEVSMYLLSTTLTAAGGRLGTVVLSSLSPPCQRQTRECYKILWSNNFATSEVLILFRRNSWQISDLHEGGAAAHEQAGSQSRCSLSSSLSGSAWQHSCKNDWPGQWGRPRVSQG